VEFLSVNVDVQDRRESAKKFLADSGCTWNAAFAATGEGAADLIDALDAGLPGYQAVIDQHGHVRAVGDLREPALQYALRAAIAEARGDYLPVTPHSLTGKPAAPRPSEPAADSGVGPTGETAAPPPAGKPSNPEAAELLRQVRLFKKTGNYTKAKELCREILEKYPGTHEAEEADFYLRSMP
jgi:hypothetical protein